MFAVINVGGKQYPVKEGDTIEVPHLDRKPESSVTIKEVLLVADGKKIDVGQPILKGTSVVCEVVESIMGSKIFPFKFKHRKGYKRKIGHRQKYTLLKVKEIKVG